VLKLEGEQLFIAGIDRWMGDVEQLAVEALRGLAVKVFKAALDNSPQFSGNAVANWKFSVNSVDVSQDDFFKDLFYEKITPDVIAYSKINPNDQAHDYAIAGAAGNDMKVKSLRDVIYVSNSVSYASWLAKATEADLRAVNHVGHLISHTIADVVEGHLFITTRVAKELATERIV
jgi:hypothetical protein